MKLPAKCKKCKVKLDIKEQAKGWCAVCSSIISVRASKAQREKHKFCPLCGGLRVEAHIYYKGLCKECQKEFFEEAIK